MRDSSEKQWKVWRDAAAREDIDAAIRALYADIDAAVAQRAPLCNASGRCCKFESYGHRLYVTALEIAWFLSRVRFAEPQVVSTRGQSISLQQLVQSPSQDACPYQIDGLCSMHLIRPLGCRVYFCEQGTEGWQQDTTERFLDRLKQLHAEHDLPYAYMEWRHGLAEAQSVLHHSI